MHDSDERKTRYLQEVEFLKEEFDMQEQGGILKFRKIIWFKYKNINKAGEKQLEWDQFKNSMIDKENPLGAKLFENVFLNVK